ncbi:Cysteine protease ATG4A [Oopsacas minuta]|uniref:Cysteine protease n=1 Tax=Oopsacas minuta TaxID=111878 RepID=A0AAV7JX15_9METZ|nr:Cysteine protease ATG4A [Oopsacas minuta]
MFMDMSLSCDTIANTQIDTSPLRKSTCYTHEQTTHISDSTGAAWLLGREYYLPQEKPEFISDVNSLLWFSYRKGFKPIGGSGNLKSDTGWGCCYRCGQMLMGHSLIRNALGRDWKWRVKDNGVEDMNPHYPVILAEFLDTSTACYSIHQLTSQAVDFGRDLGTWAGPNTVAQALRCRAKSDPLCNIVVHVAMDMLVIRQSIKKECQMSERRLAEDMPVEVEPLFSPRQFSLSSPMGKLLSHVC